MTSGIVEYVSNFPRAEPKTNNNRARHVSEVSLSIIEGLVPCQITYRVIETQAFIIVGRLLGKKPDEGVTTKLYRFLIINKSA